MNKSHINNTTNSLYKHDYKFKILILGDSGVGKTTIFQSYTQGVGFKSIKEAEDQQNGDNNKAYQAQVTTSVDFRMKNLLIDGDFVKLYIWDTAGQERYRSIVQTYFKNSNGICLVFDLTNKKSFDNVINQWYDSCKDKCSCTYILVGNKCDLENQADVQQADIDHFCEANDMEYKKCSAITNENIDQIFYYLGYQIKEDMQQQPSNNKYSEFGQIEMILDRNSFKVSVSNEYEFQKSTLKNKKKQGQQKKNQSKNCC